MKNLAGNAIIECDGNKNQIAAKCGGISVITICNLDKRLYSVVSSNITADEVVLTNERADHIKQRHPGDFERYVNCIEQIILNPDYILEANKPCTAFVLKEMDDCGERFELIIRLKTTQDPPDGYKNSVITFLRVEKKRYERYLRTKRVLYNRFT